MLVVGYVLIYALLDSFFFFEREDHCLTVETHFPAVEPKPMRLRITDLGHEIFVVGPD